MENKKDTKDTVVAWGLVLAAPVATLYWVWSQYGIKGAAGLAINWLGLGMWVAWRQGRA